MRVYFAGSITGGRQDAPLYAEIVATIKEQGHDVLTEHVSDQALTAEGEQKTKTPEQIYRMDIDWLEQSDVVVAEVTQVSLGVGYELAYAESKNIPIICLYRTNTGRTLSAMIRGNSYFKIFDYENFDEIEDSLLEAIQNTAK